MIARRVDMRKMRISFVKPLASAALGMVLAGCGGRQPTAEIIPTVPAEGAPRYQGNPLEFHEVEVLDEGERRGLGVSYEQGRFRAEERRGGSEWATTE